MYHSVYRYRSTEWHENKTHTSTTYMEIWSEISNKTFQDRETIFILKKEEQEKNSFWKHGTYMYILTCFKLKEYNWRNWNAHLIYFVKTKLIKRDVHHCTTLVLYTTFVHETIWLKNLKFTPKLLLC